MPLALAAPRIGCDRSPSLARQDCRLGLGPKVPTRGAASIRGSRRLLQSASNGCLRRTTGRLKAGCATVFPAAQQTPWPAGGMPECGEPTTLGSGQWGSGEPPQLCSSGRRFGSDLLRRIGKSRSTRSTWLLAGSAKPLPSRVLLRQPFRSRTVKSQPLPVPIELENDSFALCLVPRHEST